MYQNTGVDQLCSYRTADLRLCFHNYIVQLTVYSMQKKKKNFSYDAAGIVFKLQKKVIHDTI